MLTTDNDGVTGESHLACRLQSISSSKTFDQAFLNPRQAPIPHSTTTALHSRPVRDVPCSQSSEGMAYDPETINKKVEAMLAATAALKPESVPRSTGEPAMKTKLLSKVTGLFSRHHTHNEGEGNDEITHGARKGLADGNPYSMRLYPAAFPSIRHQITPDEDVDTRD